MSEYIIRNCKALISNDICELYSRKGIHLMAYCYCKDTNCVIKQVIDKCKKIAKDHYWGMREIRFSKEILQLFDIEEINNK